MTHIYMVVSIGGQGIGINGGRPVWGEIICNCLNGCNNSADLCGGPGTKVPTVYN